MDNNLRVLKLGINARFRLVSTPTGVQNWSSHLIDELKRNNQLFVEEIKPSNFFGKGLRGHLWEQIILPFRARKNDLLFSPANSGPIFIKKQVVCIHDALVFSHPKMFRLSYRLFSKLLLKLYHYRKIKLITVSQGSARELHRVAPQSLPVSVVGMGTPNLDCHAIPQLNKKYFIFIGGNIRRKNLEFLLPIWPRIFTLTGFKLLVTINESTNSLKNIRIENVEGIELVMQPNNEELAILYANAKGLLWPSIAEGFGIPLLEAMKFGKPFIASDVGAASELKTGNSKVLPMKPTVWQHAIIQMTTFDSSDSKVQIEKSKQFTWKNVESKLFKVLLSLSSINL